MFVLNKKEFAKFEYLIGFVNNILDIVSDPEEELDFNTKDCSVYAIGYDIKEGNEVKLSTLESNTVKDWKDNLADIENKIKENAKKDFSEKWKELLK